MVDLRPELAVRLPHELSGGQKQRVNLARALAAEPEVMLCDEVTSGLDTIVGANVIDLLKRLRKDTGVSFVFISHDLSTVASFADAIVVLYAGRVAEKGPTDEVLSPPYHPYTRLLIASVPEMRVGWLEETMEKREALAGIARGVTITEVGCPFFDRCPVSIERHLRQGRSTTAHGRPWPRHRVPSRDRGASGLTEPARERLHRVPARECSTGTSGARTIGGMSDHFDPPSTRHPLARQLRSKSAPRDRS